MRIILRAQAPLDETSEFYRQIELMLKERLPKNELENMPATKFSIADLTEEEIYKVQKIIENIQDKFERNIWSTFDIADRRRFIEYVREAFRDIGLVAEGNFINVPLAGDLPEIVIMGRIEKTIHEAD